MLARLTAWKTTLGGLAITGVLMTTLGSFGCQFPSTVTGWMAWGSLALPTLLGALSKDH
jgi:hypothetical protein